MKKKRKLTGIGIAGRPGTSWGFHLGSPCQGEYRRRVIDEGSWEGSESGCRESQQDQGSSEHPKGLVESTSSSAKVEKSTGEKKDGSTTDGDASNSSGRKGLLSTTTAAVTVVGILIILAWGCGRRRITVLLWPFIARS
ncbi:hypothetical protein HG531_002949 [Fusarium graminearum]|nr:hypothetical protein HG531_002949 [Fusarium graminearum]